jgi:histidinol-phosphate aminotransferase
MSLASIVQPQALTQPVYEPGKPIEDVARELGLDPASVLKLASNENPLGPSPRATRAVREMLRGAHLYPDGGAVALRAKLAARLGLDPSQVVVGNGSNEILELVGHVFLGPGTEAVMGRPAFVVYKLVSLLFGARAVEVDLVEHRHDLRRLAAAVTERTRVVFLPSPNNPTGTANTAEEIERFARQLPEQVLFVYDEAYAEYVDLPPDLRPLIAEGRRILCLRTFSKIYGLAGYRVGYGYGHPEVVGLLQRVRQPFNLNALAQAAALAALDDEAFVRRSRRSNDRGLRQLEEGMRRLGLRTVPSKANFLLVKVGDGDSVYRRLLETGVIVRPLRPYGMEEFVRITVGTRAQNGRLLEEFARLSLARTE